jgi:hypothetical protein
MEGARSLWREPYSPGPLLHHHVTLKLPNSAQFRVAQSIKMPKRVLCSYGIDIDAVSGW